MDRPCRRCIPPATSGWAASRRWWSGVPGRFVFRWDFVHDNKGYTFADELETGPKEHRAIRHRRAGAPPARHGGSGGAAEKNRDRRAGGAAFRPAGFPIPSRPRKNSGRRPPPCRTRSAPMRPARACDALFPRPIASPSTNCRRRSWSSAWKLTSACGRPCLTCASAGPGFTCWRTRSVRAPRSITASRCTRCARIAGARITTVEAVAWELLIGAEGEIFRKLLALLK